MAILGKLELTEQTNMEFGLEVFGTTEQAQAVRFIIEGPDFDIGCKCENKNGNVTAHIPKLKGILPAGIYESRLEVIVGDKIFTPLKEDIEFNTLVEFDVKTKKVTSIKEGVKVSIKSQVTGEDSKPLKSVSALEANIQRAIKEGYEVSKVGDHYIMKQGDLYVGLISEHTVLKAETPHNSLIDLVNALSQ